MGSALRNQVSRIDDSKKKGFRLAEPFVKPRKEPKAREGLFSVLRGIERYSPEPFEAKVAHDFRCPFLTASEKIEEASDGHRESRPKTSGVVVRPEFLFRGTETDEQDFRSAREVFESREIEGGVSVLETDLHSGDARDFFGGLRNHFFPGAVEIRRSFGSEFGGEIRKEFRKEVGTVEIRERRVAHRAVRRKHLERRNFRVRVTRIRERERDSVRKERVPF